MKPPDGLILPYLATVALLLLAAFLGGCGKTGKTDQQEKPPETDRSYETIGRDVRVGKPLRINSSTDIYLLEIDGDLFMLVDGLGAPSIVPVSPSTDLRIVTKKETKEPEKTEGK